MGYGLLPRSRPNCGTPIASPVCFAGDGCFLMYPQELATAQQYGAAIIVLVVNNGMYGTIRMHQERRFPGRVSSTDLSTPDFVASCESFGAHAERVELTEAFADAFERAVEAGRLPCWNFASIETRSLRTAGYPCEESPSAEKGCRRQ